MDTPDMKLPPHIKVANYDTDQRIPRYRGNKLVEALPASKNEDQLLHSLVLKPDFTPDARNWEAHDRLHELLGLTNFMVPLASHVQLARVIDSMMREGYVGRRPMTREHVSIYQAIHRLEQEKTPFRQSAETITPQLATALVGVSGMGKTTTVKRCLAHIPQVIYHPELDIYQITYLHVEMPSDGKGVKALAAGIIERIDALIPDSHYYEEFVGKSRASADTMLRSAARLMNKHHVGLLIVDEVQNVANTRKDEQIVMTELTSVCNQIRVPLLLIGTNKATQILALDLRQARRSLSLGLGDWGPLPRWEIGEGPNGELVNMDGEWVAFMKELWAYQWVRNPVPLTLGILDIFYDCTQGIIDLAIKLHMVSQARAILDQSEKLSVQLLKDVYGHDMRLVHPMVDALKTNDMKALIRYQDIKPLSADDLMNELERRYRAQRNRAASVRPGSEDFEQRLAAAGEALGLPPEDAMSVAREINAEGTAKNMLDAAQQLGKKLAPPKRATKPKASKGKEAAEQEYPDLSDRLVDYRNAIVAARREGTNIVAQLLKLGMAPDPEDLVCLA